VKVSVDKSPLPAGHGPAPRIPGRTGVDIEIATFSRRKDSHFEENVKNY